MMTLLSNQSEIDKAIKWALAKLAPFRPFPHEDFYQIGWVAAIQALPKFKEGRNTKLSTYLGKVIYRHLLKEVNKLRKVPLTNTDITYLIESHSNFSIEDLELTNNERTIFYYRVFDGMSFTKIGKKIGVSKDTARRRYDAIEKKIKREINNAQG